MDLFFMHDSVEVSRSLSSLDTARHGQTYWSSLKYVKPTKGNWFPTKALGVGNVSTSPLSSSISSKLLVSMSLLSSGTTGATAEGSQTRKRRKRSELQEKGKCCVNNSFSLINNVMLYYDCSCCWMCCLGVLLLLKLVAAYVHMHFELLH